MFLAYLLEFLGVSFILYVLWTQVIVPISKGIDIFPYFNDELNEAQTRLVIEREHLEIAALQKEAAEIRARADELAQKK